MTSTQLLAKLQQRIAVAAGICIALFLVLLFQQLTGANDEPTRTEPTNVCVFEDGSTAPCYTPSVDLTVAMGELPACATEDATGPCFWDASVDGNGAGQSFTVDATGIVTYLAG
jgi:hypothetical protein